MPRDCRTKNSENERDAKAEIADEGECTYHADLHKGAKPQEDEGDQATVVEARMPLHFCVPANERRSSPPLFAQRAQE